MLTALDLFCGAGGAALGLIEAGFDAVVGVDSDPRCAAVYPGEFVRADVRGLVCRQLLASGEFDFVWASPPCQRWAAPTALRIAPSRHPDLVGVARRLVGERAGAIENVPAAPVRPDVRLTGPVAGLDRAHGRRFDLYRLRHVELVGWRVDDPPVPVRPAGRVADGTLVTVTTQGGIPDRRIRALRRDRRPDLASARHRIAEMREAMGLPADCGWTMRQIGEAVPPAYARWVGERWIESVAARGGRRR